MERNSARRVRLWLRPIFRFADDRLRQDFFFLSPSFVLLTVFAGVPVMAVLVLSLTEFNFARSPIPVFIGLENFVEGVISSSNLHNSVVVTVMFMMAAVALQFILGFAISLLLYEKVRSKQLLIPVILIPMFTTHVAVGLIFRFILDPQMGIFAAALTAVGVSPIQWFIDPNLALLSVIIADVWQFTPYMAVLLLAGLESIPKSPLEAAKTDGATPQEIFVDIILPLLKPVIFVAIFIRLIDASKAFAKVFTMTQGGPGRSTETLSYYIYETAFRDFHLGIASAQSATILLMLAGFAAVQIVLARRY